MSEIEILAVKYPKDKNLSSKMFVWVHRFERSYSDSGLDTIDLINVKIRLLWS